MTDQEIIQSIRKGDREKVIRFLYKEFPKIKALVLKSGCNEVLAAEIFNDSLILLIEKVQNPKFELSAKMTTYLYGINRFLAMNELRKQQKNNSSISLELEWSDTLILSDKDLEYDYEKEEKLKLMERILKKISERCQKILELFYFKNQSMDKIAKELNFSSENSAKTQKYKCLKHAYELSMNETSNL
ncbi:MAG: sigma-70 family RNA polymerase sigma factor [Crocinitomicaceae bacterium]|nr:sigma-70 family RNA polymerase sigma factor [Crocinitomicaceae bacterium]